MKKLLAAILALIMVFSLCACEKDDSAKPNQDPTTAPSESANPSKPADPSDPSEPGEPSVPSEPTDEEWTVLEAYFDAVFDLEGPRSEDTLNNSDAVEALYKKLLTLDMSVIEKYRATEYVDEVGGRIGASNLTVNWDYASVLAGFTMLEDVLVKETITRIDNLSNEDTCTRPYCKYDTEGNLVEGGHDELVYTLYALDPLDPGQRYKLEQYVPEYVYDDTGRVSQIKYRQNEQVVYLVTATYDEAGNKVQDTIKSNTAEEKILYEYDSNNRVISVRWSDWYNWGSHSFELDYTYDDNGNVASIFSTLYSYGYLFTNPYEGDMVEYVYDTNGKVISATHTWYDYSLNLERQDQYAFTYDDQGRIHTMSVNYGDTYWTIGNTIRKSPEYPICNVEYIYGTYYIYTPVE